MTLVIVRKYSRHNPFLRGQVVAFKGLSLKRMEQEIHRYNVADWWVE